MFATFGTIIFQVIDSPEAMEIAHAWDYAEHKVIEAQPVLQWMAQDLDEITLTLGLQTAWTTPEDDLDALIALADTANAAPLVLGNGRYLGYFVITKLVETYRQLADDGTMIAIELKLTLKEYVQDVDPTAAPVPSTAPLGVVPSTTATPTAPTAGVSALLASSSPPLVTAGTSPDIVAPSAIVRSAA